MLGAQLAAGAMATKLPLVFLIALILYVGLFYLGCLLTGSPMTPFFKTVGMVALALVAALLVVVAISLMFWLLLTMNYRVKAPSEPMGPVGQMFVRMIVVMFHFCIFVVVAGAIYNWGLKIDNGQSIATVQSGIPTAISFLGLVVGIIGSLAGVIEEEPVPPAYARSGPPAVSPRPPVVSPRRSYDPVVMDTPSASTPAPVPQVQTPNATTPRPSRPVFEIPQDPPQVPAATDPAAADPASTDPGNPAPPLFASSGRRPGSPFGSDANLPQGSNANPRRDFSPTPPATSGGNVPFDTSPFPADVPQQSVRPRPESLLGKADWAMEYGQLHTALQHLYAAAIVEDNPQVWQNVYWSEQFERPLFCVMWAVGVEGALPPGVDSATATAGILPAVRSELQDQVRRSVFSKHAEALVQDVGVEVDRRKLLANARDAGVDVLAVVSLQQKSAPGPARSEVTLFVYLLDVASGRSLWRSEGLTRTRYLLARNQGQDLGVELAATAGQEASKLCGFSPNCPLQAERARTTIRNYVDTRPTNPLPGLFRLSYLHRQEKITAAEKELFVRDLVGNEAAAVLAGKDLDAKQKWVARWLPELRAPQLRRPASPAPFSGIPTDTPTADGEDPALPPDDAAFPNRRPVGAPSGGNRFFID